MTDAALNFDDLIPSEDQGSTPSAVAPNRRDAYISQRAPVMFDDLIPAAEATTPASRDSNEQRPPSRTDRFANESFGDLAKRRGQEVTGGFGEGRAGTLEGLGIMTQRSLERDSSRSAAIPMKEERDATISDIESRLKEPDLDQKTRTFLEGRLADLKVGSERLGSVAKGDASFARKDFFEKAADTRKWYEDTFGKAPEDDSLYSKIATGAGSAAQFLFDSTIAGGAAGKFGALVTGAAEGGSQNSASVYKDAIQHGATEEQALRAAGSAFVVGLAEVVPVGRAFGWLPQNLRPSFSSKLFQKIGEVAMNAGEEAAQEAFNQIANNAIAIGNGYDKDRSLTEGAGEAALIGSILGGGMTSAAVAVGGHGEPAPIRTEDTNPTVSTGETAPDVDTALKGDAVAQETDAEITKRAISEKEQWDSTISAIESRLKEPNLDRKTRALLEQELADWKAGAESLGNVIGDTAAPAATPKSAIPADQAAALNGNAPVQETAAEITKRMMGAPAAKPAAEAAPVTPTGNPAPAEAPVAEAPVEQPAEPGPEATGDTATTIPETPETIASQNQSLLDPKSQRAAVFIPRESIGDGNIERPTGPNVRMLRLPDGRGLLFWNTKKTNGLTAKDAMAMYNDGHLGQFLGLGPFTKADVAQSAAAGNPEVAVTERTPEGVEVKSAGGTTATAPTQVAELEALKDQGNTVQVEDPAAVLNERQGALDELDAILSAQAERAAAPAQQATEQVANPTEQVASQPSAAAQAITDLDAAKGAAPAAPAPSAQVGTAAKSASVREQAIRALEPQIIEMGQTVDAVLAMPEAQQRRVIEKAKLAMKPAAAPAQKPAKTQKAAATSKTKAAPVTAPGNVYETAPDGALIRVETDPESGKKTYIRTTKEIEEANGRWNEQVKANLSGENEAAAIKSETRAEQRKALREQIDETDRSGGYKNAVEETDALIKASGKRLTDDEKTQLRKNAEIAGDLMQEYAPGEFAEASTNNDKKAVLQRLTSILEAAKERGFVWGRKGVTKHNARAVVWLYDVRTMHRKLTANLSKVTYSELNAFLADEVATKKGDARNMKDRRLEAGAERSKPNGTGELDALVAEQAADDVSAGEETTDPSALAELHERTGGTTEDTDSDQSDEPMQERTDAPRERPVAQLPEGVGYTAGKSVANVKVEKKGKLTPKEIAARAAKAKAEREGKVTSKVTEPSRLAARADAPMELTQSEWDAITDEFSPDPVDDARAVLDAGGTYYYDDIVVDQELREVIMGELGTDTPERHFAVGESTVGAELSMAKHPGVAEAVRNSGILPENLRNLQADALVTVFDKIAEHVKNVKIYWLSAEDMARFDPYAQAYYVPGGDYIVAREDLTKEAARLTHVIPHEVAHAAFYHALREDSKLEAQVTALWRIARKWAVNRGTADNMYGLSNIDEFVSEMFTNPEFQGFLSSVKLGVGDLVILKVKGLTVTERGKLRTALDWLRLKVAEVFGATGTTGFDAAMQIGEALLAASKGARASYYAKHPSRAARVPSRLAAQDPMAVKLKAHGLNPRQVKEVLDTIRKDFEGKATDEQLAAIAEEILRVTAPAKEAGKAINKAAKAAKASAKAGGKALNDKVVKAAGEDFVPGQKPGRPWLLWGMTNSQIARLAERWFGVENNPVRKLTEIIENRRVTKARYLKDMSRSVADIGAAQARHSKKQMEEFFSLVHDVTMAGVHPDVPLDHEKNAHLGKDALRGMWSKDQHSKLAARFEALPDDLKEVYAKTRDTLTDAQNRMAHGLMRNILNAAGHTDAAMIKRFHEDSATEQDYATVGEELAHHLKNATELKKIKGPYFNLARRGDWVVRGTYKITAPGNAKTIEPNVFEFATRKEAIAWAKTQELKADIKSIWIDKNTGKTYFEDEEGQVKVSPKDTDAKNVFRVTVQNQHVEFVNSRKEAERLTEDLRKEGMEVKDAEPKKWERDAQNAEMLSDQFRSLMSTLDKRGTTASLTPEQKGELKGMMNEVSLRFLGSTRIQSSRLPRRYVEGASIDLLHNTYDYVTETAGYLAKLDTEPKVEAAMKELEDRTAALSDQGKGYGTGAREISNEISKRVLDPHYGEMEGAVAGAVKRLTTASFIDNLASVGYSVVNALGVATMSMPHLSGDFNPATAAHQLIRAYHDVGSVRTVASGTADTVKALGNVTATGENYLSDVMARIKEPRERAMMQELSDIGLIDSEGGLDVERMVGEKDGLMQLVDVPLDYAQNVVRAMPQAIETINRTVTALAAYRMMFAKTKDHAKSVRYAADSVDMTQGNYSASNASPMFNSMIGRVVLQFKKYSQMVIYLLARNTRRAFKGQGAAEKARGIATIAYVVAGQQIMAGTLGLPLEPLKLAIMAAHGLGLDEDDWEDFQKKVEEFYAWLTGSEKAAEVLTYGVTRGLPGGWDFDLNSRIGMDNLLTFGEPRSAKEQDEKAWLFNLLTGAPGGTAYDMASGLRSVVQGDYAKGLPKLIPLKTVADAIKAKNDAQTVPEAVLKTMGLNPGRMAREGADNRREAGEAAEKKDKRNKLITGYIDSTSMADITKMKSRIREYNNALPKDSRDRISLKWVEELRRKEYKKKQ